RSVCGVSQEDLSWELVNRTTGAFDRKQQSRNCEGKRPSQVARAKMIHQETISLRTSGHGDMHDISPRVAEVISRSRVQAGFAHVFAVGSTAAIGVIEFESGLQKDLPQTLDRLIPASRSYGHEQAWHDGNGHSHLQATLLGPSLTVPITTGKPVLGTWQQIIHLECDIHARDRTIVVTVMGE